MDQWVAVSKPCLTISSLSVPITLLFFILICRNSKVEFHQISNTIPIGLLVITEKEYINLLKLKNVGSNPTSGSNKSTKRVLNSQYSKRLISSADRAFVMSTKSRRFESYIDHQKQFCLLY